MPQTTLELVMMQRASVCGLYAACLAVNQEDALVSRHDVAAVCL